MATKRAKKKYVPRPVYYPGMIIQIHAFSEFERALDNFLATGQVDTDHEGTFIFKNNAGIVQAYDCALYIYIRLATIYGQRNNKVYNLKPLSILQNRMYERRGFDEEEIEAAKKCLDVCRQILCKIPAPEVRDILTSIKTSLRLEEIIEADLKNPQLLIEKFKARFGDLTEEEVIEKDKHYQELAIEFPDDERIKFLQKEYSKFVAAYRFNRINQIHQVS